MFDVSVIMSGGHCTLPTGGLSFALNIKNFPDVGGTVIREAVLSR